MHQPESEKLTRVIAESYHKLHAEGAFVQDSYESYIDLFKEVVGPRGKDAHGDWDLILDFGCGPEGGLAKTLPNVVSYDPFVKKYSKLPWGNTFDTIYSADVLEHLTMSDLIEFFDDVLASMPRVLFLVIATRPSQNKTLTNGINVHLIVEPMAWWRGFAQGKLHPAYYLATALDNQRVEECVLAFIRHPEAER